MVATMSSKTVSSTIMNPGAFGRPAVGTKFITIPSLAMARKPFSSGAVGSPTYRIISSGIPALPSQTQGAVTYPTTSPPTPTSLTRDPVTSTSNPPPQPLTPAPPSPKSPATMTATPAPQGVRTTSARMSTAHLQEEAVHDLPRPQPLLPPITPRSSPSPPLPIPSPYPARESPSAGV